MCREPSGHSDGPSKRMEKLSDIPTGSPNARRSFRTFRQTLQTRGEAFGHSDRLSKHAEKLSDIPTDSPNARRSFRTFRQALQTRGEAFGHSDRLSKHAEKLSDIPTGSPNAPRSRRTFRRLRKSFILFFQQLPRQGQASGDIARRHARAALLARGDVARQSPAVMPVRPCLRAAMSPARPWT